MTRIESEKALIHKSPEVIFNFLSDFNNFGKFMPEQVKDWKSTADECSFTIAGMASLGMKITERIPNSRIAISRNGSAPFDFELISTIDQSGEESVVQLAFNADLNPMMKMMAVRPLTNFLNLLVNRLKDVV